MQFSEPGKLNSFLFLTASEFSVWQTHQALSIRSWVSEDKWRNDLLRKHVISFRWSCSKSSRPYRAKQEKLKLV